MSTCQILMFTCQIFMSTCQKNIINQRLNILFSYHVNAPLTAIYLSVYYLTSRDNFLGSDKSTSMIKSHLFRQLCRLVRRYVNLSDNDVDLSDLYVDLSLIHFLENKSQKTCSCSVNAMQITTKLSDKSTRYMTSQHKDLTSRHHYLTS